ncbi:DUF2238 domain-containing protein [Caulifigura coniformis]|nr:DUF2238 domain-containing protein [Caulifigura coniformis]
MRRFPWPVVGFTLLYLAPAIVVAIRTGNGEFLFYIAVMAVLLSVMIVVHRRVQLSGWALWGLSVWGLLHMAGGLLPVPESWPINGTKRVLYSWWLIPERLKYDHVVHAFGFGVTTLVCWEGLRSIIASFTGQRVRPSLGMLTLAAAAGMGFGALNEVIEFVATLLVPETNVGGYINTGWDLVSNLAGCAIAVVAIRLFDRGVPAESPH